MKKIIVALLFLSISVFSQSKCDSIVMTTVDYPAVIVNVDSALAKDLFNKTKSWINRYFKNPEKVIIVAEDNVYLRLSGLDEFSFQFMGTATYSLNYDCEISFKDSKYKIQFINVMSKELKPQSYPAGFFNENGEMKGIKKINLKMQKGVLKTLNRIHFELYNSILKPAEGW